MLFRSESYYKRCRQFRNHGITTDHRQREKQGAWFYEMQDLGFNYRITDIQCALGITQLKKLQEFLTQRQKIAKRKKHQNKHLDTSTCCMFPAVLLRIMHSMCRKVVGHPLIPSMMVGCSRRFRRNRNCICIVCVVRNVGPPHMPCMLVGCFPLFRHNIKCKSRCAHACVSRVKALPRLALAYTYLGLDPCHNNAHC